MFLPLSDTPNPRGVPIVTYALIAANIAVYLFISVPLSAARPDPGDPVLAEYLRVVSQRLPRHVPIADVLRHTSAYDLFVFQHGFRPIAPTVSGLFLSLFLHAGFLHLFGNMLFLFIYGDNVEHRLGALWYPLAYLGTGIAATLFHTVLDPHSRIPVIGASGAISGVLGFYFIWFPHNQVRVLVLLFPFLWRVFLVSARLVLGMYLVLDNLLPFLLTRGLQSGGVAHDAHIGGFILGLIAAWLVDWREVTARPAEYKDVAAAPDQTALSGGTIHDLIVAGRMNAAARAYFSLGAHSARNALNRDDLLTLGDWLHRNGHAHAALTAYRRFLREFPRGPGAAEAHLGAGLVELESLGEAASAYQHFLDALESDPPQETAARARAGLHAIDAMQKFQVGRPRRSPV